MGAIPHENCGKNFVKKPLHRSEQDIVLVLAKIKNKVVRERIRILEFLRDFDKCNQHVITQEDFKRGLSNCRLDLTETEINTLIKVYDQSKIFF